MRIAIAVAMLLALAGAAIATWAPPWEFMLLGASFALFLFAWSIKRDLARIALINLAAVLLALAAFEAYLAYQAAAGDGTRMEGTVTDNFTVPDDVVGYRPRAGVRVVARKLHGDDVLYDVTYTIGMNGLRTTPTGTAAPTSGCIVFFGDSVTFGEGVADGEAFPHRVGERLGPAFAVHNFAFSGYGPHQMLATLHAHDIDTRVTCRPTRFIYLAILEHIARVAGLTSWDRHGPRFQLSSDGTLIRDGNFDAPSRLATGWRVPAAVAIELGRYRTWQRFFGRGRSPDAADLELFLAIVREAARLSAERYRGAAFEVILWDGRDDERLPVIERKLLASGIQVHRITRILPDFATHFERYLISPYDGHPNELMHERLARYIADEVILQ